MHSGLVISHADPRPMYLQIMAQIQHRIAVGDWPPGHELPSIRTLAAAVQVSVITVKRAYLELERDGVIVTRQGKGSFVADSAGLSAKLHGQELDAHLAAAASLGRLLGLTPDDLASRLRTAAARQRQPGPDGDTRHDSSSDRNSDKSDRSDKGKP
jgi:GntR family transcriptional regulator